MHERTYNLRSILIYLFFLILPFFFYLGRLFYLQVIKTDYFSQLADKQHRIYYKIPPKRGSIYDRKMKKLAITFDVYSVYANPRKINDKEEMAEKLSAIFSLNRNETLRLLNKDKAFVWIKRQITEDELERLNKLDLDDIGLLKEGKRFYPNQVLGSHLLGFVGIDGYGLEGLELYYDDYLKGTPGLSIITRDAKGRLLESRESLISQALDGHDLVLTIDEYIQYLSEKALDEVYSKYHAKSASIIVMEPASGEILALANRPTFNPNHFNESDKDSLRNRAVCDIFEPGSVFKIVAATCALEEGIVSLDDVIYCEEGSYKIFGHTLHDHKPLANLKFEEIIEHSSNIGVVKVSQKIKEETLYGYIKKFGFGKARGIDLPLEENGIIRPPSKWSKISISAIPIGHEIAVTTLQMLCAMSAIANDGMLVKPHLVRYIVDENKERIKEFRKTEIGRVCSLKTSHDLKRTLTKVVESGTGTKAGIKGYTVAGKTGTAQKVNPNGGYSHSKFIAVFCGFLPVDDPKLAIIVVVDEPRPIYYGGQVAAPVFKKVAEGAIKYIENYNLE